MSDSPDTIRNYQPADFNKYVLFSNEAEKLEPLGRRVLPRLIAEHLGRPNYSPEQDLFIVEAAGSFAGYMEVTPELPIGRVILDCWLHPEYRRRGLASKLLDYAIHRAKGLGARVAQVNIAEDNEVARSVLAKLGFRCVRRFFEFRLDTAKVHR